VSAKRRSGRLEVDGKWTSIDAEINVGSSALATAAKSAEVSVPVTVDVENASDRQLARDYSIVVELLD
jgi:hypothetical protein